MIFNHAGFYMHTTSSNGVWGIVENEYGESQEFQLDNEGMVLLRDWLIESYPPPPSKPVQNNANID